MLLPIGRPLDMPVDVVNVSSPVFRTRPGWIRRFDAPVYEVELAEDAPDLVVGARIVLSPPHAAGQRITATIVDSQGRHIRAEQKRIHARDQRTYPRLMGRIPLRYRVGTTAEIATWLDGSLPLGKLSEPEPFMDFSVTGLRFEDEVDFGVGTLLLLALSVARRSEIWRCVGQVIRVEPGEDEPMTSVALSFIELPIEASDALTAYTLELQRLQF